jgi:hypothetical protein
METFMNRTRETPWTKPSKPSSPVLSITDKTPNVRLHDTEPLYVLSHGDRYSCLGFKSASDHAQQIATLMARPDLALAEDEFGTVQGYFRYQRAIDAWGASPLTRSTYFDPGTAPQVAKVLERCRKNGDRVRLILGDTSTGIPWFEEFGVVGTIHRSCGTLKVPLLVEDGEVGGAAILTSCLLCIIGWNSGKVLYRHSAYQPPEMKIDFSLEGLTAKEPLPWIVSHQETVLASFANQGKAAAYLAFMQGECVEPRVFQ